MGELLCMESHSEDPRSKAEEITRNQPPNKPSFPNIQKEQQKFF